ncbi:MAG: efflux RND transporter periplasmic adaptor subunit [Pseudomonadota bacterium]
MTSTHETSLANPPTSPPAEAPAKPSVFKRLVAGIGVVAASGVIIAAMVFGTAALHWRASADAALEPHPPINVATGIIRFQPAFEVSARFVGRFEPGRETQVSFERNGLVTRVAKDEGAHVQVGDVLAQLDTEPLKIQRRQLTAQRNEIKARRDLAESTLKRQSNLNQKGWSPEQRFDEARFSVLELTAAMERLDAQIASLDLDIAKSEIKAPFTGIIAGRAVDEGAVVAAGAPVLTVMDDQTRRVRAGLSDEAASALKKDVTYSFTANGRTFKGKLFRKRSDLARGTRTVTALFDVVGEADVPFGETVVFEFQKTIEQPGAWVPLSALSEGRKGLWSMLIVKDTPAGPVAGQAAVELLHTEGERAFIGASIPDGTRFIEVGANRVITGQKIALANRE